MDEDEDKFNRRIVGKVWQQAFYKDLNLTAYNQLSQLRGKIYSKLRVIKNAIREEIQEEIR